MGPAVRKSAVLAAAMLSAALAPAAAQATHTAAWEDGGAAVPSSVDFEDVAAHGVGDVVVAVGRDSTGSEAVIYRRAADTWVEDAVTGIPGDAASSSLVGVDVSEGVAWAVGTYVDGTAATRPLLLRATGGASALEGVTAATWTRVTPPAGLGAEPRSVGLFGSKGIIGTKDGTEGTAFAFTDSATPSFGAEIAATPAAGPINDVAVYGDGLAFTGGELPPGGGTESRIYQLNTSALPAAQMVPVTADLSNPDLAIAGIAATGSDDAFAVEGNPGGTDDPGFWAPDAIDTWKRDPNLFPADTNSDPRDASATGAGAGLIEAIAGKQLGDGAVWRRKGATAWTRDDSVSPESLNGVAVVGEQDDHPDIWAVGDDGAVKHYEPTPDPGAPVATIDSGPPQPPSTTPNPTATFTFHSTPPGAEFKCSIDGAPFSSCNSGTKTYDSRSLGTHTFRVRAENPGIGETVSRSVTIVPPETVISSGPAAVSADQTPTFTFHSNLGSATFQCSLDGAAFSACSSPVTTAELGEGQHSFQVRAVSSAGTDPSPATSAFTVDLPAPDCVEVPRPLVRNVVVRKRKGYLEIEFQLVARSRVKAKAFDGGELIGRTKEKVLKEGEHTIKLRYRGGKPTRLKLAARPAANNACE